jgi:hypothetical protein
MCRSEVILERFSLLSERHYRRGDNMNLATNSKQVERPLEVGVFDTVVAAERAIDGLKQAGFSKDYITVVCSDETKERYFKEY